MERKREREKRKERESKGGQNGIRREKRKEWQGNHKRSLRSLTTEGMVEERYL